MIKKYEKGQTLLFVVVAVTIALTIGVAVSTRTISSLRRVSRTDTSARVIAAAEGGIENLLGRPHSDLDTAIGGGDGCQAIEAGTGPDAGSCMYVFTPDDAQGDVVYSRAIVMVEELRSNEEGNGYSFDIQPGLVREVSLDGYGSNTIQICWENQDTAVYYYSYNSDGDVLKGGLYTSGFPYLSGISSLFEEETGSRIDPDYSLCEIVPLVSNRYGLRVKVLYNSSKIAVFPTGGATELPNQGYRMTSRGEITTDTGSQEKATVIVQKTNPYASDIFDYGIYTPDILE